MILSSYYIHFTKLNSFFFVLLFLSLGQRKQTKVPFTLINWTFLVNEIVWQNTQPLRCTDGGCRTRRRWLFVVLYVYSAAYFLICITNGKKEKTHTQHLKFYVCISMCLFQFLCSIVFVCYIQWKENDVFQMAAKRDTRELLLHIRNVLYAMRLKRRETKEKCVARTQNVFFCFLFFFRCAM